MRAPAPDEIVIAPELAERLSLRSRRSDSVRRSRVPDRRDHRRGTRPGRRRLHLRPGGDRFAGGPRRTGLVQPGSLFDTRYRIALSASDDPQAVIEQLEGTISRRELGVPRPRPAAPGASRFFERIGQFLTLVGLAALIVAGIGVSNGVASYLRQKQDSIATLEVLGATSARYRPDLSDPDRAGRLLAAVARAGRWGAAAAGRVRARRRPAAGAAGLRSRSVPLLLSAAYGLLMALIFVLPPLGAGTHAAGRDSVPRHHRERRRPGPAHRAVVIAAAAAVVVALAIAHRGQAALRRVGARRGRGRGRCC